jgi:hypothetical protein
VTSVVLGVFFILMRFYFFGSPEFVVKRDAFVAKFGFSLLFSHLKVSVFLFFVLACYIFSNAVPLSFPSFFRCGFLTLFSLLSNNIVFSATLLLPQHSVVVVVELEEVGSKRIRIRS